jgi:uncharacterized membrane protein
LLSGIVILVIEDDEFAQFHAKQSIAFSLVLIAANIAVTILSVVLGFIADPLTLLTWLLSMALWLGGLAAWAFLIYQAYQGNWFKLPVIGNMVAGN